MGGFLEKLLKQGQNDQLLSLDIGASSIKAMELDLSGSRPRLISAGIVPTPVGSVQNNIVVRPDQLATAIRGLVDAYEIKGTQVTFSIPGPAAFTKKVLLGRTRLADLKDNIAFEASNYIPHKIENVHLDFQVLRVVNDANIEVLLVAVKNEVINSYVNAIAQAGLEPTIADVDFFALENMFALAYPETKERTVALIDIGARFSNVAIQQDGQNIFSGDVSVGGRLFTEALTENLGMDPKLAERAKFGEIPEGVDAHLVTETVDRITDQVSSELHRQIGFFWNAAATDRTVEGIYLTGGGSMLAGLQEEIAAKTGLPVERINPFRGIDTDTGFDQDYLGEITPQMAVSVGLSLRRLGDKKQPID